MSIAAARAGRSGEWLEHPGFGIYVHIPFCLHRCHYCDFNTYEGQRSVHAPYVDALVRDITRWPGEHPQPTSVFFGGGTPTLLPTEALARMLKAIRDRFGIHHDAEVTVEANPETVEEATFESLLEAGFNRFSVGVQSLVPRVLAGLGRTHSAGRAAAALRAARRAGVADLNADLIYGSPWESASDWSASLDAVIEAEPDHISAYALTIEDGTPLATLVATGRVRDVDGDVQAERHAMADAALRAAGYYRYEISNWARPGHASAHNVLYWSAGDYLGFGAGAHGHLSGRRWWSLKRPRDFVAAVRSGSSTEDGFEVLSRERRAAEALMLGLRLVSGIDEAAFGRRFGARFLEDRAETLAELEGTGLMERSGGRVRVGAAGTLLASGVASRLM